MLVGFAGTLGIPQQGEQHWGLKMTGHVLMDGPGRKRPSSGGSAVENRRPGVTDVLELLRCESHFFVGLARPDSMVDSHPIATNRELESANGTHRPSWKKYLSSDGEPRACFSNEG